MVKRSLRGDKAMTDDAIFYDTQDNVIYLGHKPDAILLADRIMRGEPEQAAIIQSMWGVMCALPKNPDGAIALRRFEDAMYWAEKAWEREEKEVHERARIKKMVSRYRGREADVTLLDESVTETVFDKGA